MRHNRFREKCLECSEAIGDVFSWLRRNFLHICNQVSKVILIILVIVGIYGAGKYYGIQEMQKELALKGIGYYDCDPLTGKGFFVLTIKESPSTE